MFLRREYPGDAPAIGRVHASAFAEGGRVRGSVTEVGLVEALRASDEWLPRLSIVAVDADEILGHVVCSRATLDGVEPVLGLGPIGVVAERQGNGAGHALMHAVLAAAEALEETTVGVLGEPGFYSRFGFRPAQEVGIVSPEPAWGDYFQIRFLTDRAVPTGRFRYAPPFEAL